MRKIEHEGWRLEITTPTIIVVKKLGESREYDVDEIIEVKQEDEYVFLQHEGGSFTQVKFEVDNFLVIDKFDKDGELINEVGAYVFEEGDDQL